ncbi:hypothetical protein OG257_34840 [Streptomyces sp. NBC_00683]|uniref:hypothetical protein n=1 Tax=Streptomyces sp. NBC_00683 TaxID=2903670 RepID=UPI002E2F8D6A|nr:hypothetical protein [Streptomyces sp. NBC_00683]
MGKFVLAVRTRPVPGSEEDYHEWYDKYHLDEVLTIPDFVAAERFEWWDGDHRAGAGQGDHLALFTVESGDIDVTIEAFRKAQKSMKVPPCLDPDSVSLQWWRSLGTHTP